MKVKIPKQIKIGSLRGNIKYTPFLKGDNNWRASYNERSEELEIDSSYINQESIRDRSFMHEVIHMIDINYEVGLDERAINKIAHGMIEFMREIGLEFDWSNF